MKLIQFIYVFFVSFPFLIFTCLKPTTYDGTSTIVYKTSNIVTHAVDTANGKVLFKGGLTVLGNACARLNISSPLFNSLDLRFTGTLDLQNDLVLDSLITISPSGGIIRGGGHTIFLNGDLTLPSSTLLTFTGNTIIDGQGHNLTIGKYAQLLVEGGISVTFKNMVIRNALSTTNIPPIRCEDWYSNVCFDDVIFELNDDFVFRNGQFFIHNDVEFTGTSKFSYRSVRPSYIEQHSNLIFSPNTTFEYYPSSTNNSLIKLMDKTSTIIFDGSTLLSTHTGIRLTTGNIYLDNKVTLSSEDKTLLASVGSGIEINSGIAYPTLPIAWSPDGRFFVLGNYGNVTKYYSFNGSSFSLLGNVDASSYFTYSLAWSPNGKYLVFGINGANASRLYKFDGTSFTYLRYVDSSVYNTLSVTWSPDGKYLVLGNYTQASKCYRFKGTSFSYMFDVDSAYNTYFAAWSPDGKYLVLGNNGQASRLYRFNESSFSFISNVDSTAYNTRWVSWSPDGKYLILANNGQISKCYMFNGSSIKYLADVGSTYDTTSVAWSPDGRYVALGFWSGTLSKIYRFNGSSFTYLSDIGSEQKTQSMAWSPDGKVLALGKDLLVSKAYPINYTFDTSPQGFGNGIIFGNSVIDSSQDIDVYLLAATRVGIYGKVLQDSVNSSWNFQSRDSYVSLDRYDSKFKITNANGIENWKKNQIIKSSQNNTMFLQDNQIWTTNMDQLAPEETFEFMDNLVIPDGQLTQFSANTVIDGQDHDLILGKYAQLLVDGGVTVTFKNMTIKNTLNTISCPPIRCMDWYSKACFDNVTFAFNDDWTFRNGQFFIHNDVNFTGTSKFSYRSVLPSYITQHSNLIFDPQTTFEFYPSTTDNALIKMADKTSTMLFDGSALQTTHTGIRLTKGSLYFDNKVTLSSADNTLTYSIGKRLFVSGTSYNSVSISLSPDGKYLVIADTGAANAAYRFDGTSFTYLTSVGTSGRVAAWSPDGKYLVLGKYGARPELYSFDGNNFTFLNYVSSSSYVTLSVAWSPDGKYLVLGNYSQQSKWYKFAGTFFIEMGNVSDTAYTTYSVAWRPDGKYLAMGNLSDVGNLYSFDGNSFTPVGNFGVATDSMIALAWSPDGRFLVSANQSLNVPPDVPSKAYVFSGNVLSFLCNVDSTSYAGRGVQWSPDGKYVAIANDANFPAIGSDGASQLYRFEGNSFTKLPSPFKGRNWSAVWTHDGKYLILGCSPSQTVYVPVYTKFDTSTQGFVNGIIFGNSILGEESNLTIKLMGGANVQIYGQLWYDNIN